MKVQMHFTNYRFTLTTAQIAESLFYGERSAVPGVPGQAQVTIIVSPPTSKKAVEPRDQKQEEERLDPEE